jgi:hypothetical protein
MSVIYIKNDGYKNIVTYVPIYTKRKRRHWLSKEEMESRNQNRKIFYEIDDDDDERRILRSFLICILHNI